MTYHDIWAARETQTKLSHDIRILRLLIAIRNENTTDVETILNELNIPKDNMTLKERVTYFYLLEN